MSDTIRLVTIGTSSITENMLDAAKEVEGLEYVGAFSRDIERARTFTQAHGGTAWFDKLEDVLASEDVDALYIASPNACHFKQAIESIRAGKNVLVEKPLCASHYEVQQLFAAANLHHIISTEAIRPLHDPAWAAIAREIPRLGTLRRATFRFGRYSSRYEKLRSGQATNMFDTKLATGALMDMGVYPIEIMCGLFGAPKEIKATPILIDEKYNHLTHGTLDGAGSVLCNYGSHRDFPGLVVEIAYSKITNDYLPSQIEGELGTITIQGLTNPTKATLTLRGETVRGNAIHENTSNNIVEEIALEPRENNMVYELRDFVAMCKGESINTMWGDNFDPRAAYTHFDNASLDTMSVLDEVRRQAGIIFDSDYHAMR